MADTSQHYTSVDIQRGLNRLERWVCRNLVKFNKAVLHLERNNYMLGALQLESGLAEKDLGFLADTVYPEPAMTTCSKEG